MKEEEEFASSVEGGNKEAICSLITKTTSDREKRDPPIVIMRGCSVVNAFLAMGIEIFNDQSSGVLLFEPSHSLGDLCTFLATTSLFFKLW